MRLSDYTTSDLERDLRERGMAPSHARHLLRDYYAGNGAIENGWRRFPAAMKAWMQGAGAGSGLEVAARQAAEDGTVKLLMRLEDGRTVECVLMPDFRPDRAAGCLSSQVGCAMGCDFCATTKTGFERNLTAGEIVEQFLALRREAAALGRRLRTVVFMGMGEPMLNLANVLAAIDRMAPNGLGGLGWRQITVSTVGIVQGIDALAASGRNVHLAVSLHAPDDATRAALLPAGKRFEIGAILEAADRYQATTGRPVSLQYCLLAGVNDSLEQADQLAAWLANRRMHVNLLRYNPTGLSLRGVPYAASSDFQTDAFLQRLRSAGVVAHVRRSRGPDIDAACGQLREARGLPPARDLPQARGLAASSQSDAVA